MRTTTLAVVCTLVLAALPVQAAPTLRGAVTVDRSAAVQQVSGGCGVGWHRVPGWRDRYGNWHPGHCVPN
jgi:hypothetical protein